MFGIVNCFIFFVSLVKFMYKDLKNTASFLDCTECWYLQESLMVLGCKISVAKPSVQVVHCEFAMCLGIICKNFKLSQNANGGQFKSQGSNWITLLTRGQTENHCFFFVISSHYNQFVSCNM